MSRRQATVETVTALLQNPSLMFIVGVITLAAGLAVVSRTISGRGGALVVVVTLVGWITLTKSLLFLFLPPEVEAGLFLGQLHYQQLFYVYGAFSLVLGVYLDLWRIPVKVALKSRIQMGLRLTIAILMSDIEGEWTPSRLSPKSSG